MRPVIEDIKTDKLVNENFENIRTTLCGNVSLDNISGRILEGITQEIDSRNLVNHSGNSRPVGWFPLVGDVYIQEINEKQIDIRSTKPQVAYKIFVIFGPPITTAALKEIGGPEYQDTEEVATTQAIEQIQLIEEVITQYKPLATQVAIFPNPNNGLLPTSSINNVVADSNYYYITIMEPTAQYRNLYRINKTTSVVDYLDLSASITFYGLGVIKLLGTDLYVSNNGNTTDGIGRIFKIDTITFTLTTMFTFLCTYKINDIYVDDTHIYATHSSNNANYAYLTRIDKTTLVETTLTLGTIIGGTTIPYKIMYLAPIGLLTGALFIVLKYTTAPSDKVVRVSIYDPVLQIPEFVITDTVGSTVSFDGQTGVSSGNSVYIPVKWGLVHTYYGGTTGYITGIVRVGYSAEGVWNPIIAQFIVIPSDPYTLGESLLNTILEHDSYLYYVAPNFTGGTRITRVDTINNQVVTVFIPINTTGHGEKLNGLAFNDSDGSVKYIRNTTSGDYGNFEVSTVDFSDYDL